MKISVNKQRCSKTTRTPGESVSHLFPGIPDTKVLSETFEKEECLLTFDKIFGELVYKNNLPLPAAIVLFGLPYFLPDAPARTRIKIINEGKLHLPGFPRVITENKTRQKKLLTTN